MKATILGSKMELDREPSSAFAEYAESSGLNINDLLPIKFWLASVGPNKNGDFWGTEELQAAVSTIALKPLNINHDKDKETDVPRRIIGVAYSGEFIENPDTGIFAIQAKAVLFAYQFRKDAEFISILERLEEGSCKSSMECIFTAFSAVDVKTHKSMSGITDNDLTVMVKEGKAFRKFDNPMFTAAAILLGVPPADPDATVEFDDAFGISVAVSIEEDDGEENKEACTVVEITQSHAMSHRAYNDIKNVGSFSDWTLSYTVELHDASVFEMEKLGISHTTPIYGEKLESITYHQIQRWVANARVPYHIEYDVKGSLKSDITIVCGSKEHRDSILDEIPLECCADIHIQILTNIDAVSNGCATFLPFLTNLFPKLTERGGIVYNYSELVIFGYANWLKENAVESTIFYGDITTLNKTDAFWIELDLGFVYVDKKGELQIDEFGDHCFTRVAKTKPETAEELSKIYLENLKDSLNFVEITNALLS